MLINNTQWTNSCGGLTNATAICWPSLVKDLWFISQSCNQWLRIVSFISDSFSRSKITVQLFIFMISFGDVCLPRQVFFNPHDNCQCIWHQFYANHRGERLWPAVFYFSFFAADTFMNLASFSRFPETRISHALFVARAWQNRRKKCSRGDCREEILLLFGAKNWKHDRRANGLDKFLTAEHNLPEKVQPARLSHKSEWILGQMSWS